MRRAVMRVQTVQSWDVSHNQGCPWSPELRGTGYDRVSFVLTTPPPLTRCPRTRTLYDTRVSLKTAKKTNYMKQDLGFSQKTGVILYIDLGSLMISLYQVSE